jgi:hypothetical protein
VGGLFRCPVAGCCEHGNEPSGFIKCGEFLDQMRDRQLLEKDSVPWYYLACELASESVSVLECHWCFTSSSCFLVADVMALRITVAAV